MGSIIDGTKKPTKIFELHSLRHALKSVELMKWLKVFRAGHLYGCSENSQCLETILIAYD